jgi:XTP/dITP diphosphohydrolase
MELIIATHNPGKVEEFKKILPLNWKVKSLRELKDEEEIAETGTTFEENALLKAKHVYQKYHQPCIADDSGLVVDALGGAPGIFSARYAGIEKSSEKNNQKLLEELEKIVNRRAQFVCAIAYVDGQEEKLFSGVCQGHITTAERGDGGFGYDPLFIPLGYDHTFAELDRSVKNKISHRAVALEKLKIYLTS